MRGRYRSGSSAQASQRRAATFRRGAGMGSAVDGALLRQRFDRYRNRGHDNNKNRDSNLLNMDDIELQNDFTQWMTNEQIQEQRAAVEISEQEAIQRRHALSHVPRIGNMNQTKPDNVVRWMYCQANGMSSNPRKLQELWSLAEKYEADGISVVEVGINWSKFRTSSRLTSWCDKIANREVRATEAYNIHAPVSSSAQQGGTAIILRHSILEFARGISHDPKGLGRWASWQISTTQDHRTRVVTAYCPGKSKKTGPGTVYCQHLTEINKRGLDCTPYQLFLQDLTEQLRCWRSAGERLILLIDSNEHVLTGPIARRLADKSIDMKEASHKFWGDAGEHNTYILGRQPIDGIYATPDIDVQGFLSLSFHESVGDHRTTFVDVSTQSVLGIHQPHIVRPTTRRLTTRQASSVRQYNSNLWERLIRHKIPERWHTLSKSIQSGVGTPTQRQRELTETLHKETLEHRLGAERDCRKILKPASEFSLPIKFWYDRIHAYQGIIRLLEGNHSRMGRSRIYRFATNHDIKNPQSLTIDDCKLGIASAKLRQQAIQKQEEEHRRQHLGNCLQVAMEKEDEEKIKEIKTRIRNEQSRKTWLRIKKVTQMKRGKAVVKVEEEVDGQTVTHTDRAGVEQAIQKECEERFLLGHCAPISNSLLGVDLRYMQDATIAHNILTGRYTIPDDLHHETALLLSEMGRIGAKVLQDPTDEVGTISTAQYQHYFRRIKENTASSPSGLHHGHDKAAAQHKQLSEFFASQMTTIIHSGIHPERWGIALQVLLEKIAGVSKVTKLRSIQLYDSHFNWFNKLIFNDYAMLNLAQSGCLPEELFSQKGRTADDACWDKTLTIDISRQSRQPLAIISVDAAQCYDRVHHSMMAMVWLALKVPFQAVAMMLQCLGFMKIFTRTGFGDSKQSFGGRDMKVPFCGLGQGSKAAPASWVQLSSVIVNCFKAKGFGAVIRDPISGEVSRSIGCLFVDDTDLYAMEEGRLNSTEALHQEAQNAYNWWSAFLAATGGAIKDSKSFWYLLSYACSNGIWTYNEVPYSLNLSTPGERDVKLPSSKSTHAVKTLGVLTAPCGGHAAQLIATRERAEKWIQKIKNGHLPASHVWLSYLHQLRPGMLYGLGTLSNDMEAAQACLAGTEYQILPLLGVNRNIKRGWRTLHQTFGGIGLIDLTVEQFICRINLFQQHYGTPSALGHKLSASIHWLQLQIGTTSSPFQMPYHKYAHLAPISWVKSLWELLDQYDIGLQIRYNSIPSQREGDMSIMDFLDKELATNECRAAANRCRCHLNTMFLSDMTSLDGKRLSNDLISGARTPLRSKMRFPPERPTPSDWTVWTDAWSAATTSNLQLSVPLGRWLTPPHFTWPSVYNYQTQTLYILRETGFRIHTPTQVGSRFTRTSTKFKPTPDTVLTAEGEYVSTDVITSSTGLVYDKPGRGETWTTLARSKEDFWAHIVSLGGSWMWELIYPDLQAGFEVNWLIEALKNGTLTGVTDGSYNRARNPNICGAGWILMDINSLFVQISHRHLAT